MNSESEPSRSSYNIVSDRLKVWFDRRLNAVEYAEIRKEGFVFWHGSKCFTRVWTPEAEDLIARYGIEIEADDDPDDTEARVERFSRYAERAEGSAVNAQDRLADGRANTARRQRLTSRVFDREVDKAEYWQGRIQASIRHANFKENPGLIARRIRKIETDLRYWEAYAAPASTNPRDCSVDSVSGAVSFWVAGPSGRSGRWVRESFFPKQQAHAARWVEHLNTRLLYEQAVLAATDSVQAQLAEPDGVKIEAGGAVRSSRQHDERWLYVVKVNPTTVAIYDGAWEGSSSEYMKWRTIDQTRITDVASKAQVDAGEVVVAKPAVIPKRAAAEQQTAHDGRVPEKLGAVGTSSTLSRALEDQTWSVVLRVDKRTVELGYRNAEGRLFKRKENIRYIRFHKTAAECAVEFPDLVKVFHEITAVKKKNAAIRKAQATATPAA